jgi:O-antigen/teichoic acid export membrane protein
MLRSGIIGRIAGEFGRTPRTRTLIHGSASVFLLRVCSHALRLLLGILLARALGASGYGVFLYAITWLSLLQVIGLCGLDQSLVRFVSAYAATREWSRLKGVLRFSMWTGMAGAALVALAFVVAMWLMPALGGNGRDTMIMTAALLPIVIAALLRQSILRGLDHPLLGQLPENILYPVLFIILLTAVRFATHTETVLRPDHAALLNAIAWLLSFLLGTVIVLRMLPAEIRGLEPSYDRRLWFGTIPPLVFSAVTYYLFSRADVLILGTLGSSREVGLYVVAGKGAELMTFVYEAMTIAGTSLFSAIFATGDRIELQRFTNLITQSIFWFSVPAYLLTMIFAPWFLRLFGPEFPAAAQVMRLLLTTYFVSIMGGFVLQMLYVTGNERPAAVVVGCAACLNVVLSLVLIPRYGMVGAAIASGASLVAMKAALVWVLYAKVGILSLPFRRRIA